MLYAEAPVPPKVAVALTDADRGVPLRVDHLDATQEEAVRLKRLGICEGRGIELVQAGDPLIVAVIGSRIGLSRRLASQVFVRPLCKPVSESDSSLNE